MKQYLITITFILLCGVLGFGQDRVNRTKLSFGNEGIKMKKFTGWNYDDQAGEWFDCRNVLIERKKNQWHAKDPSLRAKYYNNIISLQFKTITYKQTSYYVLVWEKFRGRYIYPYIQEDWIFWPTKIFLMFTEEDMEKLWNLTNDPVNIQVLAPLRIPNENIDDVDVIQNHMDIYYGKDSHKDMSITIYQATDSSIRFIFNEYAIKNNIQEHYFELTEAEYQNLLKINL